MQLPNAEVLFEALVQQVRRQVTAETALVGIYTGGVWLAERLHAALEIQHGLGTIDVSFYRDDYGRIGLHPKVRPSTIPFAVEGRSIIIVDDVLYTGRTIRAALNELFDHGRPARVDLAVLVDRGGRELPISPRYCAYGLPEPLAPSLNLQLDRDAEGVMSLRVVDA